MNRTDITPIPIMSHVHMDCAKCPIRRRAVCAYCDDEEVLKLSRIKSYKTYATGDALSWEGGAVSHLECVISGAAVISSTLHDGRKQVVGLLLPGDFCGPPRQTIARFDIEAASEVVTCRFDRRAFEALILEIPHLSERVLDMTLNELDAARSWMVLLGRKNAREKLASFLAFLARRRLWLKADSVGQGVGFDLPVSRESLADYLGLTLETVSRQFTALKREGMIEMRSARHIFVPDLGRLVEATGEIDAEHLHAFKSTA